MQRIAFLLCGILSCKPAPDAGVLSPPPAESAYVASSALQVEEPSPISDEAPLREGLGTFEGMVRPTKGGYEIRGVILEDDAFPKLLKRAPGQDSRTSDWFLGAVVRVTAELRHIEAVPPAKGGEIVQMRSGSFWQASNVTAAVLRKPAEVIEGILERSKGFFALAGKLVSRDDLAWSLSPKGGEVGDHVRLYGQSQTVVCAPNAQCLLEGSLPLFVVGRAERLP